MLRIDTFILKVPIEVTRFNYSPYLEREGKGENLQLRNSYLIQTNPRAVIQGVERRGLTGGAEKNHRQHPNQRITVHTAGVTPSP